MGTTIGWGLLQSLRLQNLRTHAHANKLFPNPPHELYLVSCWKPVQVLFHLVPPEIVWAFRPAENRSVHLGCFFFSRAFACQLLITDLFLTLQQGYGCAGDFSEELCLRWASPLCRQELIWASSLNTQSSTQCLWIDSSSSPV